jgi:hypothetical protein
VPEIVAINGQVEAVDVFQSTPLFRKLWPQLLQSYALDAATVARKPDVGSRQDATDFLQSVLKANVEKQDAGHGGLMVTKRALIGTLHITVTAGNGEGGWWLSLSEAPVPVVIRLLFGMSHVPRPNVTDHGAATIDFPLPKRPTSPLPCIGLFAARSGRLDDRMLRASLARHASKRQCRRCIQQESADGQRGVHRVSCYVSSSFPPRNSIGVQISIPERPSSSSNR